MGVAPRRVGAFHIAQGDVHPSYQSHLPVDHTQLAVVAVVDFRSERGEPHRHEGVHVDSRLTHTLKKLVLHAEITHIVVDDPHLHAFLGLVDKGIADETPKGVVVEDEGDEVNVVPCAGDGTEHGRKHFIARGEDFHLVVLEGQRHLLRGELAHQFLVLRRYHQVVLLGKAHNRPFGELVETLLCDIFLLSRILPEEDEEHNACHRQEEEHQKPCHRLHRLPVLHHHDNGGDDNGQDIKPEDQDDYPMQVNHGCGGFFSFFCIYASSLMA